MSRYTKAEIALAQARKDKEELDLAKYQKVYENLTDFENYVSMINLQMIFDLGYGKKFKANDIPSYKGLSPLKMIVDFYIPELSDDIKVLDNLNIEFVKIFSAFALKIEKNDDEKNNFIAKGLELKNKISTEILNVKTKLKIIANKATKIV